jgi:hypothetical protein
MLDLAVDAATITTLTPSCFAVGLAPMVASSAQKRWREGPGPVTWHDRSDGRYRDTAIDVDEVVAEVIARIAAERK